MPCVEGTLGLVNGTIPSIQTTEILQTQRIPQCRISLLCAHWINGTNMNLIDVACHLPHLIALVVCVAVSLMKCGKHPLPAVLATCGFGIALIHTLVIPFVFKVLNGLLADPLLASRSAVVISSIVSAGYVVLLLGAIFTSLCEKLGEDLQRKGYLAKTIGIKLRYDDFKIATRDQTMESCIADAKTIRKIAGQCLKRVALDKRLRLLGVRAATLIKIDDYVPEPNKDKREAVAPVKPDDAAIQIIATDQLF